MLAASDPYEVFCNNSDRPDRLYKVHSWSGRLIDTMYLGRPVLRTGNYVIFRELAMSFLNRPEPKQPAHVRDLSQIADVDFAGSYPALAEYVFMTTYPDGSVRLPATLMLMPSMALWTVCLNDRDTARSLWATGESLKDCFGSLDEMLRGEYIPWRADRKLAKK